MHLEVVTPKGTAVTTTVDEVTAPGARGEFGVLPGHTPFLSALRPGVLSWKARGVRTVLAVSTGFVEVSGKDRVIVLTQMAVVPEKIDRVSAQRILDEAEQKLKSGPSADAERDRDWARAQLDTLITLANPATK